MASTYTCAAVGISFALNKSLLTIFNGIGSNKIVKIYRVWALNNGVTAVTGVVTNLELRRITTGSGGTAITPIKHDTTSSTLPAEILVATNPTVTTTDLFRRIIWSNDEAAANVTASFDELETIPALSTIWDVGYTDTTVEPLVLREGFGISLINTGNTAVGSIDIFFEITVE